ncbi:UDP-N-acetylmuramoyl-L-alanine--D-glutamate ligase [Borreliella burgdorferi]|uniref:UDP-N-acetylmuramoylalanine--D-glutamate ligase n=1 Tax=Borreliella burgdorferi (strain ATCC 35210 / DSM 4680 / CIP 102532 / B31) TaxID=224326 RepID=MURD_BORBU|nr:UDP-N-acetylmuramoyl-L-alanine--D-glutamate ligase [Borreliella burgdorferi]O51532.1 RecName: Full=UDP-N-acetylmuramoylalanine--D-glutamate ligase; AltName: Full=D-glutamic acid-adding enzyme; AltName: Full=UDP-N-acetylmuramoyl-L-alanyl-D-glutamate synthetase [Borreliella burgdorferi B31]AAB91522.1 UDP-N-acetylmuramoylalanine--D-glutamate ligase [Borreliella burgdorferi B31]ARS30335.1 UDP-N-acetylmuramoyl-L-alanine--D-glutamate ligase [Borreliella burgdorferi]ARS31566.1 UDP-N-acetylmuramoyl-
MLLDEIKNLNFLIMGLGLNGGGVALSRFLLKRGAKLVITDLKSETELALSIDALRDFEDQIRYVLGKHDVNDFKNADIVVKNPGVKPNNKYLKFAKRIETDISLFLMFNKNPIVAVTGTKGKSTLVSLLYQALKEKYPGVKLGGNIGVSPLSFFDQLDGKSPLILELSSWQLQSLENFNPIISIITNVYNDHQNYYLNFDDYIIDKSKIFVNQTSGIVIIQDQAYCKYFSKFKSKVRVILFSEFNPCDFDQDIFYCNEGKVYFNDSLIGSFSNSRAVFIIPKVITFFVSYYLNIDLNRTGQILSNFKGIEHRLEFVKSVQNVMFYNDTASTIPESTVLSVKSLKTKDNRINLIVGGTDKELDFLSFSKIADIVRTWILIRGSATVKIIKILEKSSIQYFLFDSLRDAVNYAFKISSPGDIVLFSPASASFELFNNEFDRGLQFKNLVNNLG